jgi:leucyl-tRNA---protein transferase
MISLSLLLSKSETCTYLEGRESQFLFIDPSLEMSNALYGQIIKQGFRRSGNDVYRPQCRSCRSCVPVRIPLRTFRLNRNQRRCWNHNQDIIVKMSKPEFNPDQFALFRRYQNFQHASGSMRYSSPVEYLNFLTSDWGKTGFLEFYFEDHLMAVAIVDYIENALSAVYTFYEPELRHLSPGKFAVLWEIAHAQQLGLDYLYLGYWISECRKMAYKSQFLPFEVLDEKGVWQLHA